MPSTARATTVMTMTTNGADRMEIALKEAE